MTGMYIRTPHRRYVTRWHTYAYCLLKIRIDRLFQMLLTAAMHNTM